MELTPRSTLAIEFCVLSTRRLANSSEKGFEDGINGIVPIPNGLRDIWSAEYGPKRHILPKAMKAWCGEGQPEACTDQREPADDAVHFVNNIKHKAGVATHDGDGIVQTWSNPAREQDHGLIL